MDFFGIGNAIKGVVRSYFQYSRGSGRTSFMVDNLESGDRIVFSNAKEAERVKRLCVEKGVEIEAIVTDPRTPERIFERGRSKARTIFDHSFIEEYYLNEIERAENTLNCIQKDNSTYKDELGSIKGNLEFPHCTKWNKMR